jgi:hypothetical protein
MAPSLAPPRWGRRRHEIELGAAVAGRSDQVPRGHLADGRLVRKSERLIPDGEVAESGERRREGVGDSIPAWRFAWTRGTGEPTASNASTEGVSQAAMPSWRPARRRLQ